MVLMVQKIVHFTFKYKNIYININKYTSYVNYFNLTFYLFVYLLKPHTIHDNFIL